MRYANDQATAYINNNVAIGYSALQGSSTPANNTGNGNTAIGYQTLWSNTSGGNNIAIGVNALYSNTSGPLNIAIGSTSLYSNISGSGNTALGIGTLFSNTGGQNTAVGYNALTNNNSGQFNSALGEYAAQTNVSGSNNTFIGYSADVASNNLTNATSIGNTAITNASNKIRLGNASVTVIEGQVAYSFPSDGRFKTVTANEVKGLDFINKLRPVTYTFDTRKFDEFLMKDMSSSAKQERMNGVDYTESSTIIHTGFIAQEIEQAAKEAGFVFDGVHAPKDENDNYSVAYSQFVVPLVKAIQEQQQQIETQKQDNAKYYNGKVFL